MDYFCQLLYVRDFNGVRHTEMNASEVLVPEPSCFGIEVAVEKLKIYESAGIYPGSNALF
jgi:hypothetical protein